MLLSDKISPEYIKSLDLGEKKQLCDEIRAFLIEKVSGTGRKRPVPFDIMGEV